MANTLTAVIPQLLAQGMMALRENAVMPQLVNRGYESLAGEKGSTIDIPIPSAITAQNVTAAATPPSTGDITPTSVILALDQWVEAPFYLTDQDMLQAQAGILPMQASEAIKAIVNRVEADIFTAFKGVYNYVGTAGTTPFASDVSEYRAARAAMNRTLAPMRDRRVVLDPDAESNVLGVSQFISANESGSTRGIIEGEIGRKLGADWYMDQNVPDAALVGAGTPLVDQADVAIGDTNVHFDGYTTAPAAGDKFTVAGDSQVYVVVSAGTLATTDVDVEFLPAAKVAWADNAALTLKATHAMNLLFHRDAVAFGSRPFAGADPLGIGTYESMVDPVSGLAMRLEVSREHKRTRFSYDIMYGVKLVRREYAAIIAG
jgi:hypothetical protein